MEIPISFWIAFNAFILLMLWIDLKIFHKKGHDVNLRAAFGWSLFWVSISLAFGAALSILLTPEKSLEFLAGYLIEKSLSIDNIFVFSLIFQSFSIPIQYQYRVLFWGILGALILRGLMIWLSTEIITHFHPILYIMGGFLIFTGVKTLLFTQKQFSLEVHPVLNFLKRYIPLTSTLEGESLFIRKGQHWYGTPLLAALILIEVSDIFFAIDSVPAIFAITLDPFIVYTSNIFAILGLRSLYFFLADAITRFTYLKSGVAIILCFVGVKMIAMDIYKFSTTWSLLIILLILGGAIVLSFSQRSPKCHK